MATDRSPANLTGILRSLPRSWWTAESGCYNGAGARLGDVPFASPCAGLPAPARVTDLDLQATGSQSKDLYVRSNRQGLPASDAAGVLVSDVSASASLRGCDLPNRLSGTEPLYDQDRGPSHILRLRSDAVGLVYSLTPTHAVRYRRRDPLTGLWSAEVTIRSGASTETWPCLLEVTTETGASRLICYSWTASQITAYYSDDEGLTWAAGGEVLEAAISTTAHPVADRGRIRAAWVETTGQITIVAHLRSTVSVYLRDVLGHWSSSDGGGVFQRVEIMDGSDSDNSGGWPDLAVRDGAIYVAYIVSDNTGEHPVIVTLGDAWQRIVGSDFVALTTAPWLLCATVVAGAPDYLAGGELALWLDDDQALYLTSRDVTDGTWPLARNVRITADATDWRSTGTSSQWATDAQVWEDPGGGDYLGFVSATAHHGRTLVAYDHDYSGELHVGQLGGWSTLTLPSASGSPSPAARGYWQYATPWTQSPNACWFGGFGGAEVQGTGYVSLTGAGTYADTMALPGTVAQGVMYEVDVSAVTGGATLHARIRATTGDGAAAYSVEVEMTGTTLRLRDVVAGAYLAAAVAYTGRVHVAISLTSTDARAWWRPAEAVGHEDGLWTEIGSGAPTSTGAAGANLVALDVTALHSIRWYSACYSAGAYASAGWAQAPSSTTLFPRSLVTSGVWSPGDVRLAATLGPTYPGDTWYIPRSWEYGPDRLDPRGDTPTPSAACLIPTASLPAGTAEIRLSWYFGSVADDQESDLFGAYLDGILGPNPLIRYYTAGAWSSLGLIPTDNVAATSEGRTVTAGLTTGGGSYQWMRGDLDSAGCTIVSAGGVIGEARVIERSRGGSTVAGQGFPLGAYLDAAPGIVTDTIRVWPRRGIVLDALEGSPVKGIQVSIPVNVAPATIPGFPVGGYYGLSVLHAGPLLVVGHSASSSTPRTLTPGVGVQTAQDGTRSAAETGPTLRTMTISWAAIPAYSLADFVSADGTVTDVPLAYRQDLDGALELVSHDGALYPVVAVPVIPRAGGRLVAGRGRSFLYGRIMGDVSADPITDSSPGGRVSWVVEEER